MLNDVGSVQKSELRHLVTHFLTDFSLNDIVKEGFARGTPNTDIPVLNAGMGFSSAYFPHPKACAHFISMMLNGFFDSFLTTPNQKLLAETRLHQLPIPALDTIEIKVNEFIKKSDYSFRLKKPDFLLETRSDAAKMLFAAWKTLPVFGEGYPKSKSIDDYIDELWITPLRKTIFREFQHLIKRPCSIYFIDKILKDAETNIDKHLSKLIERYKREEKPFLSFIENVTKRLEKWVSTQESALGKTPLPPWYRFIKRWCAKRRRAKAVSKLKTWYKKLFKKMEDGARKNLETHRTWAMKRACKMIKQEILAKQQFLELFNEMLVKTRQECEAIWQSYSRITTLDRNILSEDRYQRYITQLADKFKDNMAEPLLQTMLEENNLFQDMELMHPTDLSIQLMNQVNETLKELINLPLRHGLELAGVLTEFNDLLEWLTADSWQYASPLLGIQSSGDKPVENRIADLTIVRPPDLPDLQNVGSTWPYSAQDPMLKPAAAYRALLCRMIYGFDPDDITCMKIFKPEYDAHQNKKQLHILENFNQLPEII